MVTFDPSAADAARERGLSRRRLLTAAGLTAFGVAAVVVYPTSHGGTVAVGTTRAASTGLTGAAGGSGAGGSSGASGGASGSSGSSGSSGNGTFTGDTVQTRWGPVQVQITVSGGKITAADVVQVPQDNPRDQEINSYAVPVLNSEVVQAQSAQIDTVSGATVTSDGYLQSLQSAIDAANLG